MKHLFILLFLIAGKCSFGQELFVFTEPASNMAANSIGLRLNNYWMRDDQTKRYSYQLLPELMWGVSKNMMVHLETFLSNENNRFEVEGGSLYLKYRFYSIDDVHDHFRVAAFGRVSFNNSHIHQPAIDFNGHNSGYEGGLVATKLINKLALSASASALYAKDNGDEKFIYGNNNRAAINYTLSVGKLMLPKEYTSYDQTNMNFMLELLGQSTPGNGYSYVDIAPSVQFIIKSRVRFDVGYRYPLVNQLRRSSPQGFVVKLEYNVFNVF